MRASLDAGVSLSVLKLFTSKTVHSLGSEFWINSWDDDDEGGGGGGGGGGGSVHTVHYSSTGQHVLTEKIIYLIIKSPSLPLPLVITILLAGE